MIKSRALAGLDVETVMDTVQPALFVMDSEARVVALNRSAGELVPPDVEPLLHELCGYVLGCSHEEHAPDGCGSAANCSDCQIRRTVDEVCSGQTIRNRRADVVLRRAEGSYRAIFLLSAAPFDGGGQVLALLSMQEITDLVVLRDLILSTCSSCGRIRLQGRDDEDPASWIPLKTYIRNASNTRFTHGLCPSCAEEFYGDDL